METALIEKLTQYLKDSLHPWQRRNTEIVGVVNGVELLHKRGFDGVWIPHVLSADFDLSCYEKCVAASLGLGDYQQALVSLGVQSGRAKIYGFRLRYDTYIFTKAAWQRMNRLWITAAKFMQARPKTTVSV